LHYSNTWVIVSFMEQVPTKESDIEKIYRIARELGIGLEEAADTCDAFHLAFYDDRMRRAIFGMIDELDESAVKKGEPLGLIITYSVELGMDDIRVNRYADEIPPGQVVTRTPTNRARILLKIKDNFPTQEFLGPIIINRPDPLPEEHFSAGRDGLIDSDSIQLPSSAEQGWQTSVFHRADGVVRSDSEGTHAELPTELPSHWADIPICLGPIRLKLNERFPFLSGTVSQSGARFSLRSADLPALADLRPGLINSTAASHLYQLTSGLSPPPSIGECGHSERKMFPGLAMD
jgi:hypothetical protein